MQIDKETNRLIISCFERIIGINSAFDESVSVVDVSTLERVGSLPSGVGACSVKIFDNSFPRIKL